MPGKSKLEEMINSVKNGYYFLATGDGNSDLNGDFMNGIAAGYEIKNGKLGRALKDTSISGNVYDVWKSATMVSDKMEWLSGGISGGKQWVSMGLAGPAIKCRVNVGGK